MDKSAPHSINAFRTDLESNSSSFDAILIENVDLRARISAQDELIATQLDTIDILEDQTSGLKSHSQATAQNLKIGELSKVLAARVQELEEQRKKLAEKESDAEKAIKAWGSLDSDIIAIKMSETDRLIEALGMVKVIETKEARIFEKDIKGRYGRLVESRKGGKLSQCDFLEETSILLFETMKFLITKPKVAEPMTVARVRGERLAAALEAGKSMGTTEAIKILKSHEPGTTINRRQAIRAMKECVKEHKDTIFEKGEHARYKLSKMRVADA